MWCVFTIYMCSMQVATQLELGQPLVLLCHHLVPPQVLYYKPSVLQVFCVFA